MNPEACAEATEGTLFLCLLTSIRPFLPTPADLELGTAWRPPGGMAGYLEQMFRPAVLFLQETVDPEFRLTPDDLDSVALVASRVPTMARLDQHKASELVIPSETANMFRILRVIVRELGFKGDTDGCLLRPSCIFVPHPHTCSMALRYGLLKDISRGPAIQLSERAQFDTIFLDFDTEEELSLYLRRPDIQNYCRIVIGPLRDIIMLVWDCFRNEALLPHDAPWGSVAEAIHPKDSAVSLKRVPTLSLASLIYMRRLIKHFSFHGDNLPIVAEENKQILDTCPFTRATRLWQ
ncbi:hypothetical protein DFH07DRAFT_765252 [Mycena maculata]|uniref:Uncharacterized protein n=1 Tax=Mycena maculata TaxID=230809 RepID=A0AAD7K917_9AGAR|nr:hypothetical protein DFH07DRAFT_765252 [Mycena maculata]